MKKLNIIIIIVSTTMLIMCHQSGKKSDETHIHESEGQMEGHGHSTSIIDSSTSIIDSSKKSTLVSPRRDVMSNIGDTHIHINYSSPGVRGRVIWGGLVAYYEVWVTGAHKATSIQFSGDVEIKDEIIPAGKYAFYTIPGEKEWTIIINKNWDQHFADNYDETEDVLRVTVVPEQLAAIQENLVYEVMPTEENKGTISMSWAKIKISLEIRTM